METTDKIYDPVGETEKEDKQYAAATMKYSANTQGRCHMSVQSKTEAEGCILWFINDCSCLMKTKAESNIVHFRTKLCSRSSQSSAMTGKNLTLVSGILGTSVIMAVCFIVDSKSTL